MARSAIRCSFAVIVAVFFACLQLSFGQDGFQLLESECGSLAFKNQMVPRIINGVQATFGAYPWMAFVRTSTHFTCGGSLISHWFVLTAAHCILDDIPLFVTLGEYNRDQAEDCLGNLCMDPVETYDVNMALRHKFYNSEKIQNDIGMLRLDRRVTYKPHIQPICVFVDSKLKPLVDNLTWFDATGWGHTRPGVTARVLQDLKLNRRPFKDCELMFGKQMFSSQICSGNDDSNLCHGDSGGPQGREMAYGDSTVYVQLGIASFTSPGCRNVSILTDVLSHGDWIKRVVRRFGVPEAAAPARQTLGKIPTFFMPL